MPRAELRVCPICNSRFSGDARFCPFDGEPLKAGTAWDPMQDVLIGTVVDDRYEIIGVLGEGGMGTVYETRHTALGRRFAVKILRAELAGERELSTRFTREARAAAAVPHPNIVQITDFGSLPSGQPYFAMELLTGRPLSALAHPTPLPLARVVSITMQVARALEAAHGAGIVHRDLKPDNIIVSNGEQGDVVKVVDFGLAQVAGQSRLTKAGMVFGTPHYVSPEQASGGAVDHRSDMYSLGVVLYEMLTCRVPFEADTFMGVMTKHMYVAPTPPHHFVDGVDLGALEDVTLKCLEKRPDRRYESMGELIAALEAAGEFSAEGFVPRPSAGATQQPPRVSLLDEIRAAPVAESEVPWWSRNASLLLVLGGGAAIALGVLLAVWWTEPASVSTVARAPSADMESREAPAPPASLSNDGSASVGSAEHRNSQSLPVDEARSEGPRVQTRTPSQTYGRIPGEEPGSSGPAPPSGQSPKIKRHLRSGEIIDPWSQ